MALVNCEIVEDSTAGQVSGEGNITARELYIKPKEGFYVAAKDFVDNTYDTYSSYVQGIIDFGPEGRLQLTDTTTPYAEDNEVKITVNLFADYSITEDTILSIDIDGKASKTPGVTVYLHVFEDVSAKALGDIVVTPEDGVTTSSLVSTAGGVSGFTRHQFTYTGQVGIEAKVATIILKAVNDPAATTVNFVETPYGGVWPDYFHDVSFSHFEDYRFVYTPHPNIGDNDVAVNTEGGPKPEEKYFEIWYTPRGAFDAGPGYADVDAADAVINPNMDFRLFAELGTANAATRSRTITNVTTDLGSLPSGSSNVIPSSGITASAPPVVKVYGTPGAVFEVEFKETKVVEGGGDSRSTNTGAVDFFGGIIPDMPVGFVTIPKSGVYSFKMPDIASFTTTGWKEFEMKITAGINTIIKSNVIKTGGTSVNIGALNSIVTNKFYQYPKVNIEFAAAALPAGWSYTADAYDIREMNLNFGGSEANRTGIPFMPPHRISTINFEIRITKTGGAFSLNTSNTFSKSDFVATLSGNRDIVKFYNLKAYIGEGTSDVSADAEEFATITGSIRCTRFGYQNQVYTIDLSRIFTFA